MAHLYPQSLSASTLDASGLVPRRTPKVPPLWEFRPLSQILYKFFHFSKSNSKNILPFASPESPH